MTAFLAYREAPSSSARRALTFGRDTGVFRPAAKAADSAGLVDILRSGASNGFSVVLELAVSDLERDRRIVHDTRRQERPVAAEPPRPPIPFVMIQPAYGPRGRPPVVSGRLRIGVEPAYSPTRSRPPHHYVFAYHVRIENVWDEPVQLFWRHWLIHDPVGGEQEVEGEGVVGASPVLAPGDVHEYRSFCVLEGPFGHMEGFYHFRRRDGSIFRAEIPRFVFRAPSGEGSGALA